MRFATPRIFLDVYTQVSGDWGHGHGSIGGSCVEEEEEDKRLRENGVRAFQAHFKKGSSM